MNLNKFNALSAAELNQVAGATGGEWFSDDPCYRILNCYYVDNKSVGPSSLCPSITKDTKDDKGTTSTIVDYKVAGYEFLEAQGQGSRAGKDSIRVTYGYNICSKI